MDLIRVLFVCSGNICRSPTAQGILEHLVEKRGLAEKFYIDSAGTSRGAMSGNPPDLRSAAEARKHGIDISSQRSRGVTAFDLKEFDYILTMEEDHSSYVNSLNGIKNPSVFLFTSFLSPPLKTGVPDPYAGQHGFEKVYALLEDAAEGFLEFLETENKL